MNTPSTISSLPQAPASCPFCGMALEVRPFEFFGRTLSLPCFTTCGCPESLAAHDGTAPSPGELRRAAYAKAGIGSAYFGARLEDPSLLAELEAGRGLYIHGPVGSGKTHLASALAMAAVDAGTSVVFASMVSLLRQLRESFETNAVGIVDRCTSCGLLVIDDLGKEKPTEWALGVLFEVVDRRASDGKPIVATSNYHGSQLAARLAEVNPATAQAVVSRLRGMCRGIAMEGRDRRLPCSTS